MFIQKCRTRYQQWKAYKTQLKQTEKLKYYCVDFVETILVALFFALLIRHYIIQTSLVPTSSMVPTLGVGDRLFVNKFVYRFKTPDRGDIVVFKSPHNDGKDYVKRCIALPGETVQIKEGIVFINDKQLILRGVDIQYDQFNYGPKTVPSKSYFVLGDNRAYSSDSRFWGYVPEDYLLGEALFTFWPINHARTLR